MTDISAEFEKIARFFLLLKNQADPIQNLIRVCVRALEQNKKIMFCGNGGSASQSQHLAAELVGRYKKNRSAMNAIALTVDTSILTAVANDYGYDEIFRRQVEGLGQPGDVLIGLSTSGNSSNIVLAFQKAKQSGIYTAALTGSNPSKMSEIADLNIAVPSDVSNHIQEMHLAIGHLICGEIESCFYAE